VATLAEAEKYGLGSIAALNLPIGEEGIAAARKISAKELMEKLGSRAAQFPNVGPDVDGWVIRERPDKVFAAGQEARIPLLIGTTSREFGSAMPTDQLLMAIDRESGDFAPRVKAVYGLTPDAQGQVNQASDPLYGTAAEQWTADSEFHCPISSEALWHSAAGNPTFEYELDHAIPGQEAQGAVHSSDLPYVWGYFPKTGNIAGAFGAVDTKLAELIETYWTNFAHRQSQRRFGPRVARPEDGADLHAVHSERRGRDEHQTSARRAVQSVSGLRSRKVEGGEIIYGNPPAKCRTLFRFVKPIRKTGKGY
jgi:para-nitrobenzyl esterase